MELENWRADLPREQRMECLRPLELDPTSFEDLANGMRFVSFAITLPEDALIDLIYDQATLDTGMDWNEELTPDQNYEWWRHVQRLELRVGWHAGVMAAQKAKTQAPEMMAGWQKAGF